MKNYLIKYSTIIVYVVLCILIECLGAYVVDKTFFIADPRHLIALLLITSAILFVIPNDKIRFALTCVFLSIFGAANIALIMLYEMTGQHFTYAMFNLRGDAMGIIENIPLNFPFTFFFFLILSIVIVSGNKLIIYIEANNIKEQINVLTKTIITVLTFSIGIALSFVTAYQVNDNVDPYQNMLYGSTNSNYAQYGITSNFVNELYKGTFYNTVEEIETQKVLNYLYNEESTPSDYFGISEGNNLVTILAETLEWYGFVSNPDLYPNGLKNEDGTEFDYDTLKELFPNFYFFFEESIVLNNYHVKEKTDVSEMYTNLGSYPTNKFINYDYADAVLPQSIGNMLQTVDNINEENINSFHNGTYTFYNRNNIHKNLGYNNYYASSQLTELFPDVYNDYLLDGERNLDSELFDSAKDLMIIEDERFYSYTLTIAMHGLFAYRENLNQLGYYDKLRDYGFDIDDEDLTDEEYAFISYLATGLDFDAALGILKDDLEKKNLLESTTVVIFSDHYAYYQGLSSYVKDLGTPAQCVEDGLNYNEMYRVPVFIYDQKLKAAMEDNGDSRIIDKFTTASDIIPTLYDILGIKYYSNMFYGNNIFSEQQSIAYSRSYDVFMNDLVYFKNLNRIDAYNPNFTQQELNTYFNNVVTPQTINLVEKIKYMNQVYEYNLYDDETIYNDYINRIKELNK